MTMESMHAGRTGSFVGWLAGRAASLDTHVRSLGATQTLVYTAQRLRFRFAPPHAPVRLLSKCAEHPLLCRPGTSDVAAFGQIFRDLEYSSLDDAKDVSLVLDCGANVGYAAAYFLSRFPRAYVIAIEPDAGNVEILRKNLAPYGGRFRILHSAVWSHPAGLVMSEEPWGDGREWARTVRIVRPGEKPAMEATDVGTLLRESGFDRISILKVDIEGAESAVFGSNYESWIGKVDNIAIELHGEREKEIFLRAIDGQHFATSTVGERFICRRAR
jgi:FkbM family methyltransferase